MFRASSPPTQVETGRQQLSLDGLSLGRHYTSLDFPLAVGSPLRSDPFGCRSLSAEIGEWLADGELRASPRNSRPRLPLEEHRVFLRSLAHTIFQAAGRSASDVRVVFDTFGSTDIHTTASLFPHGTDTVVMGYESFGSPKDLRKILASYASPDLVTGDYDGYDSAYALSDFMTENGVSGIGLRAVARINKFLKGEVQAINWFELTRNGEIRGINRTCDITEHASAVIQFEVEEGVRRHWYFCHNVYDGLFYPFKYHTACPGSIHPSGYEKVAVRLREEGFVDHCNIIQPCILDGPGRFCREMHDMRLQDGDELKLYDCLRDGFERGWAFTRFCQRFLPEAVVIKGANNMWDAGSLVDKGLNFEGVVRTIWPKTILPAIWSDAVVMSDKCLKEGYSRGFSPHPIWAKPPRSIRLEDRQRFGYGECGDRVYFGPAEDLSEAPKLLESSALF